MSEDTDKIRFQAAISTETKVADDIHVGLKLVVMTLFGPLRMTVDWVDHDAGKATMLSSAGTVGFLERRDDGWYDQHCHGSLSAIDKIKFTWQLETQQPKPNNT